MTEIKRNGTNGRRALSVEHAGLLYTSGITSTNLEGDTAEQTKDVLTVLDNILARHGIDKNRVLSATVTLANMDDYGEFNAVWDEWVIDGYEPVRSVTEGRLPVAEYRVKISLIAAL